MAGGTQHHFHMAGGKAAQAGYVKMIGPLLGSPWDDDGCGYRNGGPQFFRAIHATTPKP